MSGTAMFMGPMARKKPVGEKYNPNSYRVISQDAEGSWFQPQPRQLSGIKTDKDINIIGQTAKSLSDAEHRHNRPNPRHVNFLRQDVRLLNEPVCDVHTSSTKEDQHVWWNHHPSPHNPTAAKHTLDTTFREDFQNKEGVKGNTRHSSNPNTVPALGAVPVNMMKKPDGKQRILKEGISYEHQYNSRLDPSYPVRAKRHGSFVWNEMPPKQVDDMLHQYGLIEDKGQQATETCKAPVPEPVNTQAEQPPPAMASYTTLPPIGAL